MSSHWRDKDRAEETRAEGERRLRLGVVVGIAAGLLLGSILSLATRPLLFLLYPILAMLGGCLGAHAARKGWGPVVRMRVVVLVALVAWPISVYAPFGLQEAGLQAIARRAIPLVPAAERAEIIVKKKYRGFALAARVDPYVQVRFRTRALPVEITHFYREKLAAGGWEETSFELLPSGFRVAATTRSASIIVVTGVGDEWEYLRPSWWEDEWRSHNWVQINYRPWPIAS